MARHEGRINVEWKTPSPAWTWDHVQLEVLMDIRAELQQLNALLGCPNFIDVPNRLSAIVRNTQKRKRKTT